MRTMDISVVLITDSFEHRLAVNIEKPQTQLQ